MIKEAVGLGWTAAGPDPTGIHHASDSGPVLGGVGRALGPDSVTASLRGAVTGRR
jgi:hypothetical protein